MTSVVLVGVGAAAGFMFYKTRSRRKAPVESDHILLVKDGQLKDVLQDLTEDVSELFQEFRQLEREVKVSIEETDSQATRTENRAHNRYLDIGGV